VSHYFLLPHDDPISASLERRRGDDETLIDSSGNHYGPCSRTIIFFNNPSPPSSADHKAFQDQVTSVIGPLPEEWNQIVFDEIESRNIRITLIYAHMPEGLEQVKNDTQRIARAVLKVLVDSGRNPQRDMIAVFVYGQIPERGETGASLVRLFGKTMYDYNSDQLTFKPAKS
jgi:hypothetical protein